MNDPTPEQRAEAMTATWHGEMLLPLRAAIAEEIRDAEQRGALLGAEREREACAKIADEKSRPVPMNGYMVLRDKVAVANALDIAAAIRARKE